MNDVKLNINVIIEEYNDYVFKIVHNLAGQSLSYQDKEEIVSDTFYLLWKNQEKINTNLKSYLSVIAKNITYNKLKHKRIDIEYDDQKINGLKQTDFDTILIIEEKLKSLSQEEKEIFCLYYVDGYKIKEIAEYKGMKISNVKIKLYRIRKKLKEKVYE